MNVITIESLLGFIPSECNFEPRGLSNSSSSEWPIKLFKVAMKRNIISKIHLDLHVLYLLPSTPFKLRELSVSVCNLESPVTSPNAAFHCRELVIGFSGDNDDYKFLQDFINQSFSWFKADHYRLQFLMVHEKTVSQMMEFIRMWEMFRKAYPFQRIGFLSNLCQSHLGVLTWLINRNMLKSLTISSPYEKCLKWSGLFEAIGKSKSMNQLIVNDRKFDIRDVTNNNNNTKSYFQSLGIYAPKNMSLTTNICKVSVQQLILLNPRYSSDFSDVSKFLTTVCNVVYLECEDQVFSENFSTHYSFFPSLREIFLHINLEKFSCKYIISLIKQMPSLEALSLAFNLDQCETDDLKLKYGRVTMEFLEFVLKLNKLIFLGLSSINNNTCEIMKSASKFSCFLESLKNEKIFLPVLQIDRGFINLQSNELHLLKNILVNKHVAQLSFCRYSLPLSLLPSVFPKDKFQYRLKTDGNKPEHSLKSQYYYNTLRCIDEYLVIMLK